MIRPSSLPMLALCPKFEGAGGAFADAGTRRHEVLEKYLSGDESTIFTLPEDQQDGVIWAADYVKLKAPMEDFPLIFETQQMVTLPDGTEMAGTPDITCGSHVFDLKWRWRDYTAQMAAYAMMIIARGYVEITTHTLYGHDQKVKTFTWDWNSAWDAIHPILSSVKHLDSVPKCCQYCGWCKKCTNCLALITQVDAVIEGRPDWKLANYHSSEITTADEMGKALNIARCLADWCEAVEYKAKEMATKLGQIPIGYKVQNRQGNRFVDDIGEAFVRIGIPQEKFMKACVLKLKILFETYAALHDMKIKAAEKEVESKLAGIIQRKTPTVSLVTEIKTQ